MTATELKLNDNNFVSVYINGQDIDDKFYITQKDATNPFKIKYDIYSEKVNDDNVAEKVAINDAGAPVQTVSTLQPSAPIHRVRFRRVHLYLISRHSTDKTLTLLQAITAVQ